MKRIIYFILLISSFGTFFTSHEASAFGSPDIPAGPDPVFVQGTAPNEIKIMSYNVLNLFDADKDPNTDDWLWLPKNYPGKQKYCATLPSPQEQQYCSQFDWTYQKVDWKLNQIKKVVDFQGSRPDMMAVVEVENERVLGLLAAKLGYKHYIITNGPDHRGIDVGLMFNLKPGLNYVNWEALHVAFKSKRPGRDLLRVDFTWNGRPFSIYVNHWPSQRNPIDERITCAQALAQNIDTLSRTVGPSWSAVAVGDFNTLDTERPNAFFDIIHNQKWANSLYDADYYARQSRANPALPYTPPGGFYYVKDDAWNRLDRVVVTKNLIDQKETEFTQDSFRLLFPLFMSFMFKRYENGFHQDRNFMESVIAPFMPNQFSIGVNPGDKGGGGGRPANQGGGAFRYVRIPNRYDFDTLDESRRGFSDHLPVVFKLKSN